jgi:rhodanese-related sulfurtransferase
MSRFIRHAPLLLILLVFVTAGCAEAERGVIQPAELEQTLSAADAPLLLDVRTPEEFASGHIEGALLVPVAELPDELDQLGAYKDRGVVVYCESGGRANKALDVLEEAGFHNLTILEGSMSRWREEGLPVAKPE